MKTKIIHPFEPIITKDSKILILGSFPSVISRDNSFYYGNPKNRFWPLLSKIFELDFTLLNNEEKRKALNELHIALYDSVYSCIIEGSSDSLIEVIDYANIPELINNSKIEKIYCNGKKAYELLLKKYKEYKSIACLLPSTSPANASWSMDRLYNEWQKIKEIPLR